MRKRMKLAGLALACCSIILLETSCSEAGVGFINLQRVIKESDMGMAARAEIGKLRTEKEKIAAVKQIEIKEMEDRLARQASTMGETEKREKLEALQQAKKAYRRLLDDANEEISRKDKALVADILREVDVVLKKIAKKKKLTMILKDANVLAYVDPRADITDFVLEALDKR